jgi:DNA-binding transcriptional regulator LsrR (DeoR family)
VADYQAGMKIDELAQAHGINRVTVMKYLTRLQVDRRPLGLQLKDIPGLRD